MSEEFIRKVFSRYYRQAEFDIRMIEQREFGVGNTKKIDGRHLSFATTDAFRNFLVANTPRFVSHSAAYYKFPSATPIEKKVRSGADLIFDLDLHSEGKYDVYPKLGAMKDEVIRLVEDFLAADFGLGKKDILIAFSGNRGYHVHVRNEDFAALGSEERREITSYVRGEGLDVSAFFEWEHIGKHRKLVGPKPGDGGYRGRLAQLVVNITEKEPERLSRIFSDAKKRDFFLSGINEGNWSRTSLKLDDLLGRVNRLRGELAVRTVNADPAVTYDMSKLIRVPNSIHGETGFVAKIVRDIDSFEPLRHAVIKGPAVKVQFSEAVPAMEMLGSTYGPFAAGSKAELPLGIGMFFILKGSGALVA